MSNDKNIPYDGVTRVTTLISELSSPVPDNWLDMIDEETGHFTEEDVLTWSQEFGTTVNDACLEILPEGHRPLTDLEKKCVKQFQLFVDRYSPRIIDKEMVVTKRNENGIFLYAGRLDFRARIAGRKSTIDIKTWGSWRHHFGLNPPEKKMDSGKKSKVSLQTTLYNNSDEVGGKDDQYVLWITPDFYMFEKLKPSKKHEKALQLAIEKADADDLNF